jgi:DNA-binding Lrp family transcriptional regulator
MRTTVSKNPETLQQIAKRLGADPTEITDRVRREFQSGVAICVFDNDKITGKPLVLFMRNIQ